MDMIGLLSGFCIGLLALASSGVAHAETGILLDWKDNRLAVLSPRLPGGKVEIWYLEAFCRNSSRA